MQGVDPDKGMPKQNLVMILLINLVLGVSIFIAYWLATFSQGNLPFDFAGFLIGRDFLNAWTMAQAAFSGQPGTYFDIAQYMPYLHTFLPETYPQHAWSYPPVMMLLVAPLGVLDYIPAYLVWTIVGLSFLLFALRTGGLTVWASLLVVTSPAALGNAIAGQNGFFTAGLMVLFATWLHNRPSNSGLSLGLLCFKPQLGLVFPLALLVAGKWRVIIAASLTVAILVCGSLAAFGLEPWLRFIEFTLPLQSDVMTKSNGIFVIMMPTGFMNARGAGLDATQAFLFHTPFALFALLVVVIAARRLPGHRGFPAIIIGAALVFSPYSFFYDGIALLWIVLAFPTYYARSQFGVLLIAGLWALPLVTLGLGSAGMPGSALIPAFHLGWLLRQFLSDEATSQI